MDWEQVISWLWGEVSALPVYAWYVHIGGIVATALLTEIIKFPIKKFGTSKISDKNIRQLVNTSFAVLSFACACLIGFCVSYATKTDYEYSVYLSWGGIAGGVFEIIVRPIKAIWGKIKDKKDATTGDETESKTTVETAKAKKEKTKKEIERINKKRDDVEKAFFDLVEKAKKGSGN